MSYPPSALFARHRPLPWAVRGPIRSFNLRLRSASPEASDSLITCLNGLRQVGPGEWEFHATDFTPRGELTVGFCRAHWPE